jgi:hypothetical protein
MTMCKNGKCCEDKQVVSIEIGEGKEVMIEDLLMKLAMVQDLIRLQTGAEEDAAARDERAEPLDEWTGAAIHKNLFDVSHALKCACWGHEAAHLH